MPAQQCLGAVLRLHASHGVSKRVITTGIWESDPEVAHLFMHRTLILPKLTWHCLPKAHVSAGNWWQSQAHIWYTSGSGGTHLGAASMPACSPCCCPTLQGPLSLPRAPSAAAQVVVDIMPAHEVGHCKA